MFFTCSRNWNILNFGATIFIQCFPLPNEEIDQFLAFSNIAKNARFAVLREILVAQCHPNVHCSTQLYFYSIKLFVMCFQAFGGRKDYPEHSHQNTRNSILHFCHLVRCKRCCFDNWQKWRRKVERELRLGNGVLQTHEQAALIMDLAEQNNSSVASRWPNCLSSIVLFCTSSEK